MRKEAIEEYISENPHTLLHDKKFFENPSISREFVFIGFTKSDNGVVQEVDTIIGGNHPIADQVQLVYAFMVENNLGKIVVHGAGIARFRDSVILEDWGDLFPPVPWPRMVRHLESLGGSIGKIKLSGSQGNSEELLSVEVTLEEVRLMLEKVGF